MPGVLFGHFIFYGGYKMIKINNLNKSFGGTQVLDNVSIDIEAGDIYGIIGLSGAGKSTLLRCINGLENYDRGSVSVMKTEVGRLDPAGIRQLRRNLGMIFQNFNLLGRKDVFDNIALPMELWGFDKKAINERVQELLELVGLEDKIHEKPGNLSGGQKQRVGIARALALQPKVLLCDEATSALDPRTTKSILSLLREINSKLGLTIVIITHQMEVIKDICNKVALIEGGRITSKGVVGDMFLKPDESLKRLLGEEEVLPGEGVNIRIYFPKEISQKPLITTMARELDTDFSISYGKLENFNGLILGNLVINLDEADKNAILDYLKQKSVYCEVI
jgi:D-methionine transport system ATP-binding protein